MGDIRTSTISKYIPRPNTQDNGRLLIIVEGITITGKRAITIANSVSCFVVLSYP